MAKRISITLSDEAVRVLKRLAKPGERKRIIAKAVEHYAAAIRCRDIEDEDMRDWRDMDLRAWGQVKPASKRARKKLFKKTYE